MASQFSTRAGAICENDSKPTGAGAGVFGPVVVLCDNPPRRLFIDLDVTDDPVHGQQAMAFFNRYHDSVCYATVIHLLWGVSVGSKATSLEVIRDRLEISTFCQYIQI